MAAFAACKLVGRFGGISHAGFSRLGSFGSSPGLGVRYYSGPALRCRQFSQLVNGKRLLLVDTLALVITPLLILFQLIQIANVSTYFLL